MQTGKNRKRAYEQAGHAFAMRMNQGVSKLDHWRARFIYAYAKQEYLDEHAVPYQQLTNLLKEIDEESTSIDELKRHIYHCLASSSLLLNKLDSAVYFAQIALNIGEKLFENEDCDRVTDYFLLTYSLIESGLDTPALASAVEALKIAQDHCPENSLAFIDAHRLMGYYYVKSNYQATRALPFYQRALQASLQLKDADRAYKSLYYICRTGLLTEDNYIVSQHINYFDSIHSFADKITQSKSQIARLDVEYTMARKDQNLSLAIKKKNEFGELLRRDLPERKTAILSSYYSVIEMTIEQDSPLETTKYLSRLTDFVDQYKLNKDQLLSYHQIKSLALIHLKKWELALASAQKGIQLLTPSLETGNQIPNINQISDLFFFRQFLITCSKYYENKFTEGEDTKDLIQNQKFLDAIVACVIKMIERDDERMSKQSTNEIALDFERLISSTLSLYQISDDRKYLMQALRLTDMASNLTFFRGANQRQAFTRTPLADSLIKTKKELTVQLIALKLNGENHPPLLTFKERKFN